MTRHFKAIHDPQLTAQVTGSRAMVYAEGPSRAEDRPPHVRAASGLSAFREHLAVIQDDANWLALIDSEQRVTAVPLPPSPKGERVFSKRRGNRGDKYDLEACISVESDHGAELVGFSSGSREGTAWILRVRETAPGPSPADADIAGRLSAEFADATAFYQAMRCNEDFCGAGLNIEGALTLHDDVIRLFQRGNADSCADLQPVDATADLSWRALCAHLADPGTIPPPPLENIRSYGLGELDGVRLTFSDAEHLGGGRVLYSASAEDGESGDIMGSVLGLIEAEGQASWTELIDQDGTPFRGKIEGLTRDLEDPQKIHFVIDDDDEDQPSKIFEARLSDRFFEERGA